MRLFAIIANSRESSEQARKVVEAYLKLQLSSDQVTEYLGFYDEYLNTQDEGSDGEKKKRRLAVSSVKVIVICEQINKELSQKQKYIVLINLIEFVYSGVTVSERETEFIETVASCFNIPDEEFRNCLELATKTGFNELSDQTCFLLAGLKQDLNKTQAKYFHVNTFPEEIVVMAVNSIGIYILRYYGYTELFLSGQNISPGKIYVFSPGASIRSSKFKPIYYSDIVSCFMTVSNETRIDFSVRELEYKFRSGKTGLHPLSFSENSGKLIGIMGGSGAGKSTLLNILNGNNAPSSGKVLINGHNLHQENTLMEGVIGYIPQDDLLIEELTVYQNLFYNSKLCFDQYDDEKIHQMVTDTLNDLGLIETKDLKVGNTLDKTISGGQRKRLNIALELIREPAVLFVDEPTSGLSSRDSENIMDLLKELSLKGKLVFVVIHQPSSDIFKMFDKLLILDTGGYAIYYGNPVESVIYFKTLVNQINANESECVSCGNVNPEQVFNIIEAKVLDENGNQTRNRRISAKEWNEFYLDKIAKGIKQSGEIVKQKIKNTFSKPNVFKQFKVFITRDVLSKLSNTQYLAITLIEAPLLALILASLIKFYKSSGEYILAENKNLPAYLFMCVLVALFIGLTVSAEEIIRDRKILKRESFLNLSRGSYLYSKIVILFFVSAFQTLTFVLIGNYILEIKDMYFDYWMILFTTSCFANMLGLNISSSFNSAVTIYILIPFLLIPQILLSGVIVKFEELNPKISSRSVVPFWGEIMTSRWAFEALAVNQYVSNNFEKEIYNFDKEISNTSFKKVYWAAKMMALADDCLKSKNPNAAAAILFHEVNAELKNTPQFVFKSIDQLKSNPVDKATIVEFKAWLKQVKEYYGTKYDDANQKKDDWAAKFNTNEAAKSQYLTLLNQNQNAKLEQLVKNVDTDLDGASEENGRIIATGDPIFRDGPNDRLIRSHFFAPRKNIFGRYFSTFWVNIIVIWLMSLFLAITLYFDALRGLLRWISTIPGFFKKS